MHPFYRPLHAADSPDDLARLPKHRDVHCTCPGWCRGRDSADWLTCSSTCRHCNPRSRRRRSAPEHLGGEHA